MLGGLKKILFWTYPRGCWQYDLAVAAILAFIFLTPRSVFDGSAFKEDPATPTIEQQEQEPEDRRASKDDKEQSETNRGIPEPPADQHPD